MRIKETKVYKFEELPEEIQEKVIDRMRYINVDDSYWYDYDGKTGFTSKELKRMRLDPYNSNADELITWKNLYFDLDRGSYIQFTDARFKDSEIARKFLRVPKNLWDKVTWRFKNQDYGGSCHGTTKLVYESEYWENPVFTDKQREILDRAVEIFSDKMDEALSDLRKNYEYLTTDEAIKETILCNEYEFTIDGKFA